MADKELERNGWWSMGLRVRLDGFAGEVAWGSFCTKVSGHGTRR